MPKTSQKYFDSRGARGEGGTGGTVFLKSTFLAFLVVFLQTLAWIDARNLPTFLLTLPGIRGDRGDRGDSFLKIYILGIFGDISSNLS